MKLYGNILAYFSSHGQQKTYAYLRTSTFNIFGALWSKICRVITRETFEGGWGYLYRNTFRNFHPVQKYFFAKNEDFSKIFETLLHRSPQNPLFIFFIEKFPQNLQKELKKFSRRLRRRKRVAIPHFSPLVCRWAPPPRGVPPKSPWLLSKVEK